MAIKKVRMKVSIAATNFSYGPGQIVEVAADVADKWCDGGLAEPVLEDDGQPTARVKRKKKAGDDDGIETGDGTDGGAGDSK